MSTSPPSIASDVREAERLVHAGRFAEGEARYLRDTIRGVAAERAPDDYVRRFFDRFAPDFDQRLTRDLEYRVPSLFTAFLAPLLAGREGLRVVDLGCGTGPTPAAAGLAPVAFEEADLRKEDGKPVHGLLFALRKT